VALLAWPFLSESAKNTRKSPKPPTLAEILAKKSEEIPTTKWETPESKDLSSVKIGMLTLNATGLAFFMMPILLYLQSRKQRFANPVKKERRELPGVIAEHFNEAELVLKDHGFDSIADVELSGIGANVVMYLSVFMNRATNDSCAVVMTYVLRPNIAVLHNACVQFGTRFPKARLLTNNSHALEMYYGPDRNRNDLRLTLPTIENVNTLLEIHRARVAKFSATSSDNTVAPLPAPGNELTELATSLQGDFDRHFHCLQSIKGVFLGSWSIVWPASLYRQYAARRAAKRELIELGFEHLTH
jgi:hypothetical protein